MNQIQSHQKKANKEPCPTFGPCPDTKVADFDLQKEVEHLPFKLNLGNIHLDKEHQAKFIDLIYSNQEVFPLHDEDLGYCDWSTHTIPMSTDKPVYLPHRTIPRQLQGEVCECLNIWLCQGIIWPSNSPYASQVVTVHKKTGEIHVCVDYRKLNSITIWDACPLPTLTRHYRWCTIVFTSFDLAQAYLHLAMAEDDTKKTAFRAASSGLYKCTHMPFGMSNAGSSFCRLMEQCLGDLQFVTLLLYLDDNCIFAPDVAGMLDQIEMVFNQLKYFNMKIKPKNITFSGHCDLSWSHLISWWNFCQPTKSWESKRLACAKECHGIIFIPWFGILLPMVHSELHSCGLVLAPIDRSNQHQED